MKIVVCEECGNVASLKVLEKIGATKRGLMCGEAWQKFLCQNCGAENEVKK